jgi:hypothetical protein
MKNRALETLLAICVAFASLAGCGGEQPVDIGKVTAQPKAFVGSDTCKMCHLEHYDSWKMTLHSRGLQDVLQNKDAILVDLDEQKIRASIAKSDDVLYVPADKIYVPKTDEVRYTMGSQWKQFYVVEKADTLYVAPIRYNIEMHAWDAYYEENWDKRPWLQECGGCHATGTDLEKKTFKEPGVSCEACHGKGSWHAALPKTAVFEKRQTIVNPAKLTLGVAVQICGSCHGRGESTKVKGAEWPVGFEPGRALEIYFRSPFYSTDDVKQTYADAFTEGHHQQYIDWLQSRHFTEGVTCTSCHYVHQIGVPPTRSQTISAGSQQCFECHTILSKTLGHAIHSFANCVGCHMPRFVKSDESGLNHSHVFISILPIDTLKNPDIPNSCQTCHAHKNADLKKLQEAGFPGSTLELDQPGGADAEKW